MVHRLTNKTHWIPWVYLALIVFSVFAITVLYVKQLNLQASNHRLILANHALIKEQAKESRQRDAAIQASRTHSCQVTYSSFEDVFHALVPNPTGTQKTGFIRLHKIIRHLVKQRCPVQTKPKFPPH